MPPQAYLKPLEALARGFFFHTPIRDECGKLHHARAIAPRIDRSSPAKSAKSKEGSGVRTSRYFPVLLPSVGRTRTHAFFPSKGRNEADHGMLGTAKGGRTWRRSAVLMPWRPGGSDARKPIRNPAGPARCVRTKPAAGA